MKHPGSTSWYLPSQALKQKINTETLSWLSDEGSLTLRLKRYCPNQFSVDVLDEQWVKPDLSEAQLLGVPESQKVLLRQVHLKCGDSICVYARSVIPLKTLQGKHKRLSFLGSKPLGEYLFSNPTLERKRIEWSQLPAKSTLYKMAIPDETKRGGSVWGRRSLFSLDNKQLLVSEFFLPELLDDK